jgi:hypothetical protein
MSSATPDFNALLDKQADDIKAPQPLPLGTFVLLVTGKEFGQSSQKKTPYVRFLFRPQQAEADVDPATLEGVDLSSVKLRDDFYLTDPAMYRLVNFIKACGIQTEGRRLMDLVNSTEGAYVKAHIKVVPNRNDPTHAGFNEIDTYATME